MEVDALSRRNDDVRDALLRGEYLPLLTHVFAHAGAALPPSGSG